MTTDGPPADRGAFDRVPVDVSREDGARDGGLVKDAGGGSHLVSDDCLPSCLADVRRACRYPFPGQGTCVDDQTSHEYCFSNGVRELLGPLGDASPVQGIEITMTDGRTPCYYYQEQLQSDGGGSGSFVFSYYGGDAKPIGIVTGTFTNNATNPGSIATCPDGNSFSVDLKGTECMRLTEAQCTTGTCP